MIPSGHLVGAPGRTSRRPDRSFWRRSLVGQAFQRDEAGEVSRERGMSQLPPEYAEPMRAFVEGRQPWPAWPRWLAVNARGLARLLPRDHMRRLRDEPAAFLPLLLAQHGFAYHPAMPPAEAGNG